TRRLPADHESPEQPGAHPHPSPPHRPGRSRFGLDASHGWMLADRACEASDPSDDPSPVAASSSTVVSASTVSNLSNLGPIGAFPANGPGKIGLIGVADAMPVFALVDVRDELRSVVRNDLVDDPVLPCLVGGQEVVALHVFRDAFERLACVLGDDLFEARLDVDDLTRLDLDVGCLPLEAGAQ